MASLALGAVGAVIGAPFGLGAVGFSIGSALGGYLFAPDLPTVEGPRIDDLSVTASSYGLPIKTLYGTARLNGNVLWAPPKTENRVVQTSSGGKGGGQQQTSVSYTYSSNFAVSLCEGPIVGVSKIWANAVLIYDIATTGQLPEGITLYLGSESQTADPLMETFEGAGDVPGYRGLAYLVFNELALADYGNRIPSITVEVVKTGTLLESGYSAWETLAPNPPSWGAGRNNAAGVEHNGLTMISGGEAATFLDVWSTYDFITWYEETSDWGLGKRYNHQMVSFRGYIWTYGGWQGVALTDDLHRSNTGAQWEEMSSAVTGEVRYGHQMIVFKGMVYILGGAALFGAFFNDVIRSHDGVIWTRTTAPWEKRFFHACCVYDGKLWLSGGRNTSTSFNDVWYTSDGINWTQATASAAFGARNFHYMVTMGGYMWSYGSSYGTYKSSDGITWTETLAAVARTPGIAVNDRGDLLVIAGDPTGNTVHSPASIGDTPPTLAAVITDICASVGLAAGDIDVTDLSSDTVGGYVLTRQMSARAALLTLAQAFQFDVVESDFKIKFIKRGGAVAKAIPSTGLAAYSYGQSRPDMIETVRMQEMELPYRILINYMSKAFDYQKEVQLASRLITSSVIEKAIEFPIVLTDDEAAQLADILLLDAWTGRESHRFSLPLEYIDLDPADVVTITDGSATHTVRIASMELKKGVINVESRAESASVYSSNAVGTGDGTPATVTDLGPTIAEYMDIPILRDDDNNAGWYLAASGYLSTWPGCSLLKSLDAGASYNSINSVVSASILGSATDVLGSASVAVFDWANTVNVRIRSGTLSSDTEANVLNGANSAILGDELIQWVTATLEADGTYTLSQLIRGRRGTEWAVGTHVINERFVVVSTSTTLRMSADSSELNLARLYKAATLGSLINTAGETNFTNTGIGLKPYAPAHLEAVDVGSGNFDVAWVRRTRIAGEWRDLADVPLGEDTELYRVQVYSGSTQLSTADVVIESATVAATAGNTIKVAQVSAILGAGYFAEVTA